ncbi:hypothetical protein J3S85_10875 [Streptomyces lavenduligriseus]|nr:hypothetical protein J3S85_10875 [Streptomyces lavenduligriseus]
MSLPQITRLLRWEHPLRGEALSLLRAAYQPDTRQATVVVSQLADQHGVTYDFSRVANAAWPLLRAELSPDIRSIVWVAHFGDFSQHDPGGPETFTVISLKVTENGYEDDDDSDRAITADEVTRLFGGQPLAPVPEVLAELEPST